MVIPAIEHNTTNLNKFIFYTYSVSDEGDFLQIMNRLSDDISNVDFHVSK